MIFYNNQNSHGNPTKNWPCVAGELAQIVECLAQETEVMGSNPGQGHFENVMCSNIEIKLTMSASISQPISFVTPTRKIDGKLYDYDEYNFVSPENVYQFDF